MSVKLNAMPKYDFLTPRGCTVCIVIQLVDRSVVSEPASQSRPTAQWTALSSVLAAVGNAATVLRVSVFCGAIQLRRVSVMQKGTIVAPSKARTPGGGMIRYDYGTIAVTSLEYALSWLEEFMAVTT